VDGWHWWSPQGDQIVFDRGRGGRRELFITDLAGRERQLTYLKDFNNCETWAPHWSRDGSRIVFTVSEPNRRMGLYTITPDGKESKKLDAPHIAYSPRWSTDGEWILFINGDQLMRVRKDGTGLYFLGELPNIKSPFSLGLKN
jgi:Tol biopolymer transport system component